MNFAKMIRPHVIPAVLERFCVKGRRTHCVTGDVKDVRCVFEVAEATAGKVLRLSEGGGVTGHESFYVSGEYARAGILEDVGSWCA